ncbi:unnamed protein product [Cyclocybe aegerita]|uniref:Uncharacterized protein n=1 Tax=Cyclocybe aegerita TaxID=1973307 RepID=A0A8S0WX85_CYCAE|nr:unnamed protein product [Cyclocybe aegerita]
MTDTNDMPASTSTFTPTSTFTNETLNLNITFTEAELEEMEKYCIPSHPPIPNTARNSEDPWVPVDRVEKLASRDSASSASSTSSVQVYHSDSTHAISLAQEPEPTFDWNFDYEPLIFKEVDTSGSASSSSNSSSNSSIPSPPRTDAVTTSFLPPSASTSAVAVVTDFDFSSTPESAFGSDMTLPSGPLTNFDEDFMWRALSGFAHSTTQTTAFDTSTSFSSGISGHGFVDYSAWNSATPSIPPVAIPVAEYASYLPAQVHPYLKTFPYSPESVVWPQPVPPVGFTAGTSQPGTWREGYSLDTHGFEFASKPSTPAVPSCASAARPAQTKSTPVQKQENNFSLYDFGDLTTLPTATTSALFTSAANYDSPYSASTPGAYASPLHLNIATLPSCEPSPATDSVRGTPIGDLSTLPMSQATSGTPRNTPIVIPSSLPLERLASNSSGVQRRSPSAHRYNPYASRRTKGEAHDTPCIPTQALTPISRTSTPLKRSPALPLAGLNDTVAFISRTKNRRPIKLEEEGTQGQAKESRSSGGATRTRPSRASHRLAPYSIPDRSTSAPIPSPSTFPSPETRNSSSSPPSPPYMPSSSRSRPRAAPARPATTSPPNPSRRRKPRPEGQTTFSYSGTVKQVRSCADSVWS